MNPRKNDFERAVSLLHRDGYTCVLCDRDRVLTSREHGLTPLIRLLDTNESLQDMAAADRLIGRAAALLLLCRFLYLSRYVVYSGSEAYLDFDRTLSATRTGVSVSGKR